jgi:hypothetical protein
MSRKAKLKIVPERPKPECQVIPFTRERALEILFRAYPTAAIRFRTEELYRPSRVTGYRDQVEVYYWFKVDSGALDYFSGGAWNSIEEAFRDLIGTTGTLKKLCGV